MFTTSIDKCRRLLKNGRAKRPLRTARRRITITFALERFKNRKCLAFLTFSREFERNTFGIFDNFRVRARSSAFTPTDQSVAGMRLGYPVEPSTRDFAVLSSEVST